MYARILLCYDGSREGRLALREGARLAQLTGAGVTLLAVVETVSGNALAQGADVGALSHQQNDFETILEEGRQRLTAMGLSPEVRLEFGDPVAGIARVAAETGAELVVVGHHRHGFWTRWLSRSVAAELGDKLGCSLLLAQKTIDDSQLFPKG
ncbi:universal stress protein [Pseudogemmobacter humi]|uniref:Universal stress protein family protein n=1 Tax=Pseudogemmobacter humi TaxID=2483812 RepID=A0A3P5WY45_9RHOB|nr:universal stress protein [Pseudogemmobacter humi]VDC19862.1 Universal stress protein family protein [Pseudogemmobacter humi]